MLRKKSKMPISRQLNCSDVSYKGILSYQIKLVVHAEVLLLASVNAEKIFFLEREKLG